jgi:hypothetical protein
MADTGKVNEKTLKKEQAAPIFIGMPRRTIAGPFACSGCSFRL